MTQGPRRNVPQGEGAPSAPARMPPDVPADTGVLGWVVIAPETVGLILEDCRAGAVSLAGKNLDEFRATGAVLEGVSLAGVVARSARWRDVRFVKCDLSNAVLRGVEARRVEMVECRMLGMKAVECRWEEVLVAGCDARYAQFRDGALRRCEFRDNRMEESDFAGADLSNTAFAGCALQRADLTGAKLAGADLRGADLEGILVRPEDVRGATVSAAQAMELARLLGLKIG